MTESEFRSAIVREALTWIGTPYRNTGRIKGVGVNCAQLLFGVAEGAGVLKKGSPEPRWYTPQLATHSKEERLIDYVKSYGAHEVQQVAAGDFLLYKTGLAHGHAAIIIEWPGCILHCLPPHGCQLGHANEGKLSRYERKFFSLWSEG